MKTKHFFDIGGNIGQTFDWLATLPHDYNDHVMWVFEPSPRHFHKLIEKCKKMSGKYKIKLCPFGLGGETTTHVFYEKDDDKGDSFEPWLKSDHEVANINQGYEVHSAIVSLPEFILKNTKKGDEIVLDIDAEGSEYAMLEALIKKPEAMKRVKRVIAEFHFIKKMNRFKNKRQIAETLTKRKIEILMRGFA